MTFRFNEGGGPVEGSKACSRCGHAHQEEGSFCGPCGRIAKELGGPLRQRLAEIDCLLMRVDFTGMRLSDRERILEAQSKLAQLIREQ